MATPETALKKATAFDVDPRLGDRKERGIEEIEKKVRKDKVGWGMLFGREQMLGEDARERKKRETLANEMIGQIVHS